VCEALLDKEYSTDDPPPRVAHAKELARVLSDSSDIPLRAHQIENYNSLIDAVSGTPHAFECWVAMQGDDEWVPDWSAVTPDQ
jgi:hypothetical protein